MHTSFYQFTNAAGTERSRRCSVDLEESYPGTPMRIALDAISSATRGSQQLDTAIITEKIVFVTECVRMADDTPWWTCLNCPMILSTRVKRILDKYVAGCCFHPCIIRSDRSSYAEEYWLLVVSNVFDCADYEKSYDVRPKHSNDPLLMQPVIIREKVPKHAHIFRIRFGFDWVYISDTLAQAIREIKPKGTLLRPIETV